MAKYVVKTLVGLGAASAVAISGAALANSQTPTAQSSSTSSSSNSATQAWGQGGPGFGGMHHQMGTPVTGTQLTQVKNAVKAKDSAVTVDRVVKKKDGSFEAFGTKAGKRVRVEVSKDLKTVKVETGGSRGGHGMRGDHQRPADVTGSTLTSIKNAVKAKDSSVTVEHAFKTPDGNYIALGKKGSTRVAYQVSSDFKTVTVEQNHMGGFGRGPMGGPGAPGQQSQSSPSASGAQNS